MGKLRRPRALLAAGIAVSLLASGWDSDRCGDPGGITADYEPATVADLSP